MLWLTKFYKLPSFSPVVRYHRDLQNNLFSNILLCIIIGDLPKWNTLKRNTKIILLLKASQIIFFHSFWRSNLWFWKLSTNRVKCSHKQFGGKVSVAMIACETHQLGFVAVRFTCEKDLTSNDTSTVWTYINEYLPNHVIHGILLTSLFDQPQRHNSSDRALPCALRVSVHHFQILLAYPLCYVSVLPKSMCNTHCFHMPFNLDIIFSMKTGC